MISAFVVSLVLVDCNNLGGQSTRARTKRRDAAKGDQDGVAERGRVEQKGDAAIIPTDKREWKETKRPAHSSC